MKRLWLLPCLIACADANDGATPYRSPRPNEPSYCAPALDVPTPLGMTGAQLLARYGAPFDTGMARYHFEGGAGGVVARDQVHVELALRHDDEEPRGGECDRLALPVTVSLRGAILDELSNGVLVGSPASAYVNFGVDEHLSGTLELDGERHVSLTLDGQSWGSTEAP